MSGGHQAVLWRVLLGQHQGMAVDAADALLDMQVVLVLQDVIAMAVDAQLVGSFEQRGLAVRVVTI